MVAPLRTNVHATALRLGADVLRYCCALAKALANSWQDAIYVAMLIISFESWRGEGARKNLPKSKTPRSRPGRNSLQEKVYQSLKFCQGKLLIFTKIFLRQHFQ